METIPTEFKTGDDYSKAFHKLILLEIWHTICSAMDNISSGSNVVNMNHSTCPFSGKIMSQIWITFKGGEDLRTGPSLHAQVLHYILQRALKFLFLLIVFINRFLQGLHSFSQFHHTISQVTEHIRDKLRKGRIIPLRKSTTIAGNLNKCKQKDLSMFPGKSRHERTKRTTRLRQTFEEVAICARYNS